ncbi:MAG TPA: AAA family ATPase [Tepidisphaeraceae bacterium]|jgi:capsular exopolysaccharide synthesis family protein|nr:AAA family ATPase [Tepidisphaeraceae bacterium]
MWWSTRRLLLPVFTAGVAIGFYFMAERAQPQPVYQAVAALKFDATNDEDINTSSYEKVTDIVLSEIHFLREPDELLQLVARQEVRAVVPWLNDHDSINPPARANFLHRLESSFSVEMLRGSNFVRIETRFEDPASAVNFANVLADQLVARCLKRQPPAAHAPDDPDKPIHASEAFVRSLETQKEKFIAASDVIGMSERQAGIATGIERFRLKKARLESARTAAHERLDRLRQNSADGMIERFSVMESQRLNQSRQADRIYQDAVKERLIGARDYNAELAAGKTEQHRDVIIAAGRVKRADALIKRREEELKAEVHAAIVGERDAAIADANDDAQNRLDSLIQQELTCDNMLRELEEKSTALASDLQRRSALKTAAKKLERQIQEENHRCDELALKVHQVVLEVGSSPRQTIHVDQMASLERVRSVGPPVLHTSHRRMKYAAIAGAGGFSAASLLMFAIGASGAVGTSVVVAEHGGAPRIGDIPFASPQPRNDTRDLHFHASIADSFYQLGHRVEMRVAPGNAGDPFTLCVTSAHRREGRTTVAAGLAIALNKNGKRILLVDADLRHPFLHKSFGVPLVPGFCELVEGNADHGSSIFQTKIQDLDLLPAGRTDSDPTELLAWADIGTYLKTVGRDYDYLIIDTGPLLASADKTPILASMDCYLLVNTESTSAVSAAESICELTTHQGRLLGTVMNRNSDRENAKKMPWRQRS